MKNRKRWQIMRLFTVALLISVFQMGCSLGGFGKANVDSFNINLPSGLNGQNKAGIVQTLGIPNKMVTVSETEYWRYDNHNGWAVQFSYLTFGKTNAKELVLEFNNEIVTSSYLVDTGSSIGIITTPLSIAQ